MKLTKLMLVLLSMPLLVSACSKQPAPADSQAETNTPAATTEQADNSMATTRDEPIKPIVAAEIKSPAIVELGKKLYFDPRLSKSGAMSCNTCHNLAMGGTDNMPTSIGHKWAKGPINAPTVLNSTYGLAQFWDGRAKDLQEQAGGPIANPIEMGSSHEKVVSILNSIPAYRDEFKQAFNAGSDTITIEQVTDAIAQFEDTLVTPNSRFDQWLRGDDTAINEQEQRGYELFKNSGCVSCHNGEAVGGASYQKFGVFAQYTTQNLAEGRFAVTGKEEDKMVFKVPTLRNIELTYPYFHDGAVNSLEDAVNIMGKIQLNKDYTAEETADIVAFLKTLTGEQPKIEYPILPPSNKNTPLPNPFGD